MSRRRRTTPAMIAMPSSKSIRRQRPDWDIDNFSTSSSVHPSNQPTTTAAYDNDNDHDLQDFEADFLSEYGSLLPGETAGLTSNNAMWGLRDVRIERSLQISPALVNFGNMQRGAVCRNTVRLHN